MIETHQRSNLGCDSNRKIWKDPTHFCFFLNYYIDAMYIQTPLFLAVYQYSKSSRLLWLAQAGIWPRKRPTPAFSIFTKRTFFPRNSSFMDMLAAPRPTNNSANICIPTSSRLAPTNKLSGAFWKNVFTIREKRKQTVKMRTLA